MKEASQRTNFGIFPILSRGLIAILLGMAFMGVASAQAILSFPSPVAVTVAPGGTATTTVTLTNVGNANLLRWDIAGVEGGTFPGTVTFTPTAGVNLPQGQSTSVTFTVSAPGGTALGSYVQYYQVSTTGTALPAQTLQLNITVGATGSFNLSTSTLTFSSTDPGAKTFSVTSATGTPVNVTAQSNGAWVTVSPSGGTTPVTFTVSAVAQSFNQTTTITVQSGAADTKTVTVNWSTTGTSNLLTANQTFIALSAQSGGTAASTALTVSSLTGSVVNFSAARSATSGSWLNVTPATASTAAGANVLTITADPAGLAANVYTGTIIITPTSPAGSELQIPVTFTVTTAPGVAVDKASLLFSSLDNVTVTPTAELVAVTSTIGAATQYTVTTGVAWIVLSSAAGTTPGSFQVSINPALAPNNAISTGTITVAPVGGGSQATVTVRFAKGVAAISASPDSLTMSAVFGGSTTSQFTVTSTAATTISLIPSGSFGGLAWLEATTSTGTSALVTPGAPVVVTVTANRFANLSAGTYPGSVLVASGAGNINVPVTLTVGATGGTGGLTASPTSVNLTTAAPTSSVLVTATTVQSFYAYVNSGSNWLQVSPSSGTLPAYLTVTGNATACGASCTGSIFVTSGTGSLTIPVYMNVTGGGTGGLTASPSTVALSGATGGGVQTTTLSVFGSTTTTFSAVASTLTPAGSNWLTIVQTGSTTPATINVQADPSGLSAGTYSGTISISSTIGNASVPVTFTVTGAAGILSASPSEVNFTTPVGTNPTPVSVAITASTGASVPFTVTTSGQSWISVSPTSGNTGSSINISANVGGLTAGIYLGAVTVDAGVNGKKDIPVVLNLGGSAGTLTVSPSPITFSVASDAQITCQDVSVTAAATGVSFVTTISAPAVNWLSVPASGVTGTPLRVCISPSGAGVGTFTGTIVINSTSGSAVVTVNLTVGGGGTGTGTSGIVPSPASIALSAPAFSTTPVYQNLSLTPVSATSFNIFATTSTGQNWLSVSPASGTAPTTVLVQANPLGLASGTYSGYLTISTGLGSTTVPVTFTVGAGGTGQFTVTPSALAFTATTGTTPAAQTVQVNSLTGVATSFYASPSGAAWLIVSANSALTPSLLTVNVNPVGLSAGTYTGFINLASLDGTTQQTIPVTFTVGAGGLSLSPASLTFTAPQGGTAAAQTVAVSSTTGTPQAVIPTATTTSGGNWLNVTPASANTPANFEVSVNAAGLQQGSYSGQIAFSSGIVSQVLQVTLSVTAPVTISVSPESLTFTANQGAASAPSQNVSVSSSGSNIGFTAAAAGGNWLTVSPTSGTTPSNVAVSVNPSGLSPGDYTGTITITAPGAGNSPRTVQVRLTIVPTAPQITSVANTASGATELGALSAGALVTIKGRNLGPATGQSAVASNNTFRTDLAETRVFFGGVPSPLLYVQEGQINAVVPFGIAGAASTVVTVEHRGQRSQGVTVPLTEASPGIFTADASGQGPGAILNQDYSLNTLNNAAEAGSYISAYATGFGLLQPIPADGAVATGPNLPQPMLPVSALVGNAEARVVYAGQAPGFVAGGIQVNIQIPSGLAPGVYPITLRVGRFSSQLGVTVAVR